MESAPVLEVKPFIYSKGLASFSVNHRIEAQPGQVISVTGNADSRISEFLQVLAGLDDVVRETHPATGNELVRVPVAPDYSARQHTYIRGVPLLELDQSQRARAIAFVFANPEFAVLGLTVAEEIRYTQAALGIRPPQYPDPLIFGRYGLYDKLEHSNRILSGGEMHRLGIACAMEREAALLVLDLTRSNLDADFEDWLLNRLDLWMEASVVKGGRAVILSGIEPARVARACKNVSYYTLNSSGQFSGIGVPRANQVSDPIPQSRTNGDCIVASAEDLGRMSATTRRLSFGLHAGQVLCFHGPNGSGKTSVGKLLTGQESPHHFDGKVYINPTCRPTLAMQHCERSFLQSTVADEIADDALLDLMQFSDVERLLHPRGLPYQKQKLLSVAVAAKYAKGFAVLDEPSCGMGDEGRSLLISLIDNFRHLAFLIFTHDTVLQRVFKSTELGTRIANQ